MRLPRGSFHTSSAVIVTRSSSVISHFITRDWPREDLRVGVVVMSNYDPYSVVGLGERLIDALH